MNFGLNRRTFLQAVGAVTAGTALAETLGSGASSAQAPTVSPDDGVKLHWLEGKPTTTTGAAWGVPWPRGAARPGTSFALTTASGKAVPVQSWPLAYWPDGSLKWTGHAIGCEAGLEDTLRLASGTPAAPPAAVRARKDGGHVTLDNGTITVTLATSGPVAIRSITCAGRTTASAGRLVLRLQDRPDDEMDARHTRWSGMVESATIEQSGPVRAVVKLVGHFAVDEGRAHGNGHRRLLPWTMRVYLGAGAESLRLVHSFIWNGDVRRDFIRGLGLEVQVPMTDPSYNRHVRFTGSARGVWGEPVLVLTGLRREPGAEVDAAQVAGTATPPVSQWAATVRDGYRDLPVWNDFTLVQHSAREYSVWKRTSASACWLKDAGAGDRSTGFGYVGGVSGGLGIGIRDFWQQHPRAIDIRGAAGDIATVTAWSWSPHAAPMDMRPYDKAGHGLDLAYEDDRKGWGVPTGIARSTEIQLWAFTATPSRDRIADLGATVSTPPQLVTGPAAYQATGVFGRWGLPDRSTAGRRKLEDSIDAVVDFYAGQVDERRWYGFWNHGDIMHTYDADRHTWRYDVGGYAWDNGELGSDAMLWYAFLRTGRATTFRLAQAMTRHISEADTYHAGPFAGLGSRHNVLHWGDGAKEARVAESYTKRFMYYLTADELLGDMMRSALQVDATLLKYPPLRDMFDTPKGVPTVVRIGPDWYAVVSNWLTEWERTGDTKWRDRIVTGMRDIAKLPAGLFTGNYGGAVGFDPGTGHVTDLAAGGDYKGGYNLAMAFCGDQIMFEAVELVDVPEFRARLLEFARYVQAPSSEKITHFGFDFDPQVFGVIYSRVTAWAGEQLKDPDLQKRGWEKFTSDPTGTPWPAPVTVDGPNVAARVHEIPGGDVSTNDAAQRGLAIIELLAIAPGQGPS